MAPPSPRSTFSMIMESQDQNQGEGLQAASLSTQDQNQEGRQESLSMTTMAAQDQNQEGRQALHDDQQQNIDAEPQLGHDDQEARQNIHEQAAAGRASGDSHALRVYRGNWRGAQERSVLRKMIEDLRKEALDRLNNESPPDVNVRMLQQHHYQALPNYLHINPSMMRSSLMVPPVFNRLLPAAPAPAFMPAYPVNYHPGETSSYPFFNPAETMEGNNNSSSTVLMTKDLLSNFGKNSNSNNVTDAVLPPVLEEDNNTPGGFNSEHGESSTAGPGTELKEIDFLGLGNRSGEDHDNNGGVDLNLGL